MKFTYAPDGQLPLTFDIDVTDLTTDEAEALEEAGGGQWETFAEWATKLGNGGWRAWRAALWIILCRTNPTLKLDDVKPRIRDLQFDLSDDTETPEVSVEGKSEPDDDSTDSP